MSEVIIDRETGVEYHRFHVTKAKIVNEHERSPAFSRWRIKYKRRPKFFFDAFFWFTDSVHSSYYNAQKRMQDLQKLGYVQTEVWNKKDEVVFDHDPTDPMTRPADLVGPVESSTQYAPRDYDTSHNRGQASDWIPNMSEGKSTRLTRNVLATVADIPANTDGFGFVKTWDKDEPHPSEYIVSDQYVPIEGLDEEPVDAGLTPAGVTNGETSDSRVEEDHKSGRDLQGSDDGESDTRTEREPSN